MQLFQLSFVTGLLSRGADAANIPATSLAVSSNPVNVLDKRGYFVRCCHSDTPSYCLAPRASCRGGRYVVDSSVEAECKGTWACWCDNDSVY